MGFNSEFKGLNKGKKHEIYFQKGLNILIVTDFGKKYALLSVT